MDTIFYIIIAVIIIIGIIIAVIVLRRNPPLDPLGPGGRPLGPINPNFPVVPVVPVNGGGYYIKQSTGNGYLVIDFDSGNVTISPTPYNFWITNFQPDGSIILSLGNSQKSAGYVAVNTFVFVSSPSPTNSNWVLTGRAGEHVFQSKSDPEYSINIDNLNAVVKLTSGSTSNKFQFFHIP